MLISKFKDVATESTSLWNSVLATANSSLKNVADKTTFSLKDLVQKITPPSLVSFACKTAKVLTVSSMLLFGATDLPAQKTLLINSPATWQELLNDVASNGGANNTYILTQDIGDPGNLSTWVERDPQGNPTPYVTQMIGSFNTPFKGTFDGNGNTVWLNISSSDAFVGLFSCIGDANVTTNVTIKNLTVRGSIVSAGGHVAGIVGYALGNLFNTILIQNCTNYVNLSSGSHNGGILGCIQDSKFISFLNCVNYGSISGGDHTGGICGHIHSGNGVVVNVIGCSNYGNIVSIGHCADAGGIIGMIEEVYEEIHSALLDFCFNNGTVAGGKHVGGIVGRIGLPNGYFTCSSLNPILHIIFI